MHCDRCNVDFPDGLRYCKWCGEALADRPRITSELHSCPSCSAAIQPGWTFCKACGERLQIGARHAAAGTCPDCGAENEAGATKCSRCGNDLTSSRAQTVVQESADTSLIAMCAACGERLDTGSLYCKACGSSVYTEQTPFGGSALLCGACKSYSPLGSSVCRVCGADFTQGSRTVVDSRDPSKPIQQKAPTLPDLDTHVSEKKPGEESEVDSGARTFIFTATEPTTGSSIQKGSVDTNVLSGASGKNAAQQAPTAVMQMGRITGPVEADEVQEPARTSGGLTNASSAAEVKPPEDQGKRAIANDKTVEFAAVSQSPTAQEPTTLGLGSETESESVPDGSENKTAVFVSPAQTPPPISQEQIGSDDIRTRKFAPVPAPPASEPIREIQQSRRGTADRVAATGQMISAPQRTLEAEPVAEISQREVQASAHAEVSSQHLPKKRTGTVIATVVVALILVGGGGYVGWLLFGRGKPAPVAPPVVVQQPQVTPEPPPVPDKPPAPVVPEGMVMVGAGNYAIGRDGADPLEQPEHKVELAAFFIDRTEVTNAAYKKFVDATGHKPPSNWSGATFPEGRDNFPVTGVSWQDAADYAAWAGKRLPSEAEWEAAARGTDGRIYPWGNDWRSGVANIGQKPDKATPDQYPAGLRGVGRYTQGASPAGVVDMIGNAWEWVEDEINVYAGNSESKLDLSSGVTYRVIRGGAYDGSKVNDATYRGYLDASQAYPKVGFRCAKDAR